MIQVRRPLGIAMLFVVALSSAGCGSIPDAEIAYYKSSSKVSVKVTRTVACDLKNNLYVASSVTPTVTHFADLNSRQPLRLSKLRGAFADTDVKFEFYEDGRLKSVNSTMTGQGEAVLKAVTTLASTLAAFAANTPQPTFPNECAFIKEFGGGKPITVNYESDIDPLISARQSIVADPSGKAADTVLSAALGGICAVVDQNLPKPNIPVTYARTEGDIVLLVRQPAWVAIRVGTPTAGNGCTPALWTGRALIAQLGMDYVLPIPRAATFGKQVFAASFAESGAISSLQYASNSGAAGVVGGVNSLMTIAQGETTAAKVAEAKAEADLIVQQQRLAQCMADPKNCK